jgi:myosin heavy subunit
MKRTPESEFPPHVFTIAHDAYYGITAFRELQSIIISGESGAGKTEATKQCAVYATSHFICICTVRRPDFALALALMFTDTTR